MFFIQCPNYQNISFPATHFTDPTKTKVKFGQDFLQVINVDASNVPTF